MKKLQNALVVIGAIALICVAAFFIAGTMIPGSRSYTNEVEINAPADEVWEVINDRKSFVEWQTQLTRVEEVDERNWIEYPKDAPVPLRFTVAADERPGKMEFHYTMGDNVTGHWKGELTPTTNGVKLKTTDTMAADGTATKLLLYAFFDMEKFARDWNGMLKARVESLN